MSWDPSGGLLRHIIRQAGQQCAARGHPVSESVVAFMVKAVVLDPRNDFDVDQILTKKDVQNLIQLCVSRLLDTTNPSLSTIKMQVYFDLNYANRAELLREHRRVLEGRLAPLLRDITDSRPRTQEEMKHVYQRIVSYVLLSSGLGSPTDIEVVREVIAALQSIFPQTALVSFLSLSKKDKEQQLKNLTMLVTGIRLYNKECGKGGKGIDDLPAILNEAIPAATQSIEDHLNACHVLAHHYTALLESMHEDQNRYRQLSSLKLKEALFNVRQYEAFLCILLSDTITSGQEIEKLNVEFTATMGQLKSTIQNKVSVDTKEAFPLFVAAFNLWSRFQDEILLLSFLTNMTNSLQQFLETQSQLFPEELLTSLLEGVTVKTDKERIRETMGTRVNVSDFKNQEWLFPETTTNFDELLIQYHGFCAHAIGVKGLTLPGNPAIGILKHKDRCYVFSSKESAYIFAQDPDKFIQLNVEKAKEHAELIQLLNLHHQFGYLAPHMRLRSADKLPMKPVTKCDSGTQTDTHILPPTIVKSYEWNEWELRRKAIKLANLRRKLTHAMQTDLSHLRRENSTQVYLPKDVSTQTKRDSSSSVPRPQIFLAGLRGGSSATTEMVKVDLTRPVDKA
ncbi:cilia- and flagella-associated protein 206 [Phasianus colchicus]|uniref:Cilia- and flagella-associated protein 206 n=1 Tax=Phasianus colchicus TaxID=9054 RepID=A0A669QDC5_PHACC|nr:cilia- and flagella-associated protein 206 [Phasianus colchicus]XP_031466938.1 cilia- and flagella-associated protein 206 [Phasianus colchicus]XP_031466939.1 cilia- and flagella-associated protein 206 [Phasianus colchicus]